MFLSYFPESRWRRALVAGPGPKAGWQNAPGGRPLCSGAPAPGGSSLGETPRSRGPSGRQDGGTPPGGCRARKPTPTCTQEASSARLGRHLHLSPCELNWSPIPAGHAAVDPPAEIKRPSITVVRTSFYAFRYNSVHQNDRTLRKHFKMQMA